MFDPALMDAVVASHDQSALPGIAIGIAISGTPVYRRGLGLATMDLPLSLSPTIRMRIGSVTKHITCLAYLLLCEDGKAGIDDPIGRYLPELPSVASPVTVRQLMGHISGLRDAFDISVHINGTSSLLTNRGILDLYGQISDVNAAPDERWSYNNGGYQLLSLAIERIAGQSLEDLFRTRIFEPLGMRDTLLRRFDSDFTPNSASMHMTKTGGGFERSYLGLEHLGDGGIVSSIDDMLRWLAHMDAPMVGSTHSWELIKQAQVLMNGTSTGYGLGLILGRYRDIDTIGHAGVVMGGNAQLLKLPEIGVDIVIIANRHDVDSGALAYRIIDSLLSPGNPIELVAQSGWKTGVFQSPTTRRIVQISLREDHAVALIDGQEIPMICGHDGSLRPLSARHLRYRISTRERSSSDASILFTDFGTSDVLVAVPPKSGESPAIAGRYRAQALDAEASIVSEPDGISLQMKGQLGLAEYRLIPLARGLWHARSISAMAWGGVLSIDSDGDGFCFTTSRTRNLTFSRVLQ
jgi:D-aminopeptidase